MIKAGLRSQYEVLPYSKGFLSLVETLERALKQYFKCFFYAEGNERAADNPSPMLPDPNTAPV
jgi:hypothetical protein